MEIRSFFGGKLHKICFVPNQIVTHVAASFCCSSQSGRLRREMKCSNSSENQLRSLDSYFGKLENDDGMHLQSRKWSELMLPGSTDEFAAKKELTSLEIYFRKLNRDARSKAYMSSSHEDNGSYVSRPAQSSYINKASKPTTRLQLREKDSEDFQKMSNEETSHLYLIGILAAMDIAVFLFDIASPIRNSELQLFSLPMLYGAKINQLILVGEWWRLLTPMFLHSGVLHIGLNCWMLVSFGPQVCRLYGPFCFFLIYVLGGISGNLVSFLHTPDPAVCGTGPVFAIMGALIAYQIQNRGNLMRSDAANDEMIQKAFIATCLSCTLSNFGPVDDWTHIGAAFTGLAFGFLTCPVMFQVVDDKASESGQEEGIRIVSGSRYGDSCKSFGYFCLFIFLWGSLLFVIEPPL